MCFLTSNAFQCQSIFYYDVRRGCEMCAIDNISETSKPDYHFAPASIRPDACVCSQATVRFSRTCIEVNTSKVASV